MLHCGVWVRVKSPKTHQLVILNLTAKPKKKKAKKVSRYTEKTERIDDNYGEAESFTIVQYQDVMIALLILQRVKSPSHHSSGISEQ